LFQGQQQSGGGGSGGEKKDDKVTIIAANLSLSNSRAPDKKGIFISIMSIS